MKVLTVVGIRKSGKTSTVEALCRLLRKDGKTVGTCKTVFCPTFSMDQPKSNTARHRAAGAELITARAKNETAVLFPEALPLSRLLSFYEGFDWVLLEGDYHAPVPRLVAAHDTSDALQRMNGQTIAFTGRIADKAVELPLPCFNSLTESEALLAFLEQHVPDIEPGKALDQQLPPVPGVSDDGFCQCGCLHHARKAAAEQVTVSVNGKSLTLTEEMRKTVLSWAEKS